VQAQPTDSIVGPTPPLLVEAPPPAPEDEADEDDDDEDDDAVAASHVPGALVVDEQTRGGEHPLPPTPRHPVTHVCELVSQTRPEVALPQSASVAHPQVSFARHAPPGPAGLQFCVWFDVHSTQWFVGSQTRPFAQSGSFRHCTQVCGWTMVLHTGSADVVQSLFWLHGSARHAPTCPVICVQYLPVLQLFVPPSRSRQPVVHTPVATVDVSQ
jgi:hypothetical protein